MEQKPVWCKFRLVFEMIPQKGHFFSTLYWSFGSSFISTLLDVLRKQISLFAPSGVEEINAFILTFRGKENLSIVITSPKRLFVEIMLLNMASHGTPIQDVRGAELRPGFCQYHD